MRQTDLSGLFPRAVVMFQDGRKEAHECPQGFTHDQWMRRLWPPGAGISGVKMEAAPRPKPPAPPLLFRTQEARRQQLLAILARDGGQYAVYVEDPNTDPVVMALATPHGTCDVLIPKDRYDPFAVLEKVQQWEPSGWFESCYARHRAQRRQPRTGYGCLRSCRMRLRQWA